MISVNKKGFKEINSLGELHGEFGRATLLFSGKETHDNWELRVVFLKKVITVLLSEKSVDWSKDLNKELQYNMPAIMPSIHSNRTAVATVALSFVDAIASSVVSSLSMYTLETMMNNLLKISSITKKDLATQAFKATNHLLSRASFHTKIMAMLCKTVQEKNPQLREFSASYIQTVLTTHGSCQFVKSRITNEDLNQPIQTFIQKGLIDATPTVREACKKLYSVYNKHWPTEGEYLCQQMDPSVQRRLAVKPSSSSYTKSTKPLLHRVKKSTSSIQKPSRRLAITKANSTMIKNANASTAVQSTKTSSPLSTASVPLTNPSPSLSITAGQVSSSSDTKSKKPIISRTKKSTGSIQKPSSRLATTKANSSMIQKAITSNDVQLAKFRTSLSTNDVQLTNLRPSLSTTALQSTKSSRSLLSTTAGTANEIQTHSTADSSHQRVDSAIQLELQVKVSSPSDITKSKKSIVSRAQKSIGSIKKPSSRLTTTKANSSMIQKAITSNDVQLAKLRPSLSTPAGTANEMQTHSTADSSQLELQVKVSSSSDSTKAKKALISRTNKSTGSIQKPNSRVTMTKTSSSMIKNSIVSTAAQTKNPSSSLPTTASTFSIANRIQTHITAESAQSKLEVQKPCSRPTLNKETPSIIKNAIASTKRSSSLPTTTGTTNKTQTKSSPQPKLGVKYASISDTKPAINRTVKSASSIQKPSSKPNITKERSPNIKSAPVVRPTKSSMLLALANKSKMKNM